MSEPSAFGERGRSLSLSLDPGSIWLSPHGVVGRMAPKVAAGAGCGRERLRRQHALVANKRKSDGGKEKYTDRRRETKGEAGEG